MVVGRGICAAGMPQGSVHWVVAAHIMVVKRGICAADVPQEACIDGRLHISLIQIPASGITRHTNYAPTIRLDDCACARTKDKQITLPVCKGQ